MSDNVISGADPYLYPGLNVLKNRLEIRESHRLHQAELELTPLRAATIELGQPNMGLPHLCAIHYTLFQDLFDWAGKLREVDILKDDTPFCHFAYIEREGNNLSICVACPMMNSINGWRTIIPKSICSILSATAAGARSAFSSNSC
jgi:cell filamentation protein